MEVTCLLQQLLLGSSMYVPFVDVTLNMLRQIQTKILSYVLCH